MLAPTPLLTATPRSRISPAFLVSPDPTLALPSSLSLSLLRFPRPSTALYPSFPSPCSSFPPSLLSVSSSIFNPLPRPTPPSPPFSQIWDLQTASCVFTLTGHTHTVRALCSLEGGMRVASGSDDRTVRVWDVRQGKQTVILQRHSLPVRAVCSLDALEQLVSASEDKTVRVWDHKTNRNLLTLKVTSFLPPTLPAYLPSTKAHLGGGQMCSLVTCCPHRARCSPPLPFSGEGSLPLLVWWITKELRVEDGANTTNMQGHL